MTPECTCGRPSARDYEDRRLCEKCFESTIGPAAYQVMLLHEKIDRLTSMVRIVAERVHNGSVVFR